MSCVLCVSSICFSVWIPDSTEFSITPLPVYFLDCVFIFMPFWVNLKLSVSSDFMKDLEYWVERAQNTWYITRMCLSTLFLCHWTSFISPVTTQSYVTWPFSSFLLLFHCFFFPHLFKPPNSCLPYSLRQGCKIPSPLMCRVIICKWQNAQTKWT